MLVHLFSADLIHPEKHCERHLQRESGAYDWSLKTPLNFDNCHNEGVSLNSRLEIVENTYLNLIEHTVARSLGPRLTVRETKS